MQVFCQEFSSALANLMHFNIYPQKKHAVVLTFKIDIFFFFWWKWLLSCAWLPSPVRLSGWTELTRRGPSPPLCRSCSASPGLTRCGGRPRRHRQHILFHDRLARTDQVCLAGLSPEAGLAMPLSLRRARLLSPNQIFISGKLRSAHVYAEDTGHFLPVTLWCLRSLSPWPQLLSTSLGVTMDVVAGHVP